MEGEGSEVRGSVEWESKGGRGGKEVGGRGKGERGEGEKRVWLSGEEGSRRMGREKDKECVRGKMRGSRKRESMGK